MTTVDIAIREFEPGDEAAFRRLNEEWIERFFVLEKKDREAFDNPQATILAKGGKIFFATRDGEPVGCCALAVIGPNEFEVAKMGVTASAQGSGIGWKLLKHTVDAGRALGATRLYLETNNTLTPAITLYERAGFQRLPPKVTPYARANVFMELVF